jgi:hypothetical protein
MTDVIVSIAGFAFFAYLLGHKHGKRDAERQAQQEIRTLRQQHAAHQEQALREIDCLRSRYDQLGQRYLSAVRRVRRPRRREWGVGRN